MAMAALEESVRDEELDWMGPFWEVEGPTARQASLEAVTDSSGNVANDFDNTAVAGGVDGANLDFDAANDARNISKIVPMDIKSWISTLCFVTNKVYLENAIHLAFMLTEHISNSISPADASAQIRLWDIASENVVIFVGSPTKPASIESVELNVTQKHDASQLLDGDFGLELGEAPPISSRAVCSRLGKIFLEVFSRGYSCKMDFNGDDIQNGQTTVPNGKRVASESISSSKSSRERNLLHDLEVPLSICRLVCDLLDAENDEEYSIPDDENIHIPVTSLDEVLQDLSMMKDDPEHFLIDCTCPQKAVEYACILENTSDGQLFGRDKEISALMAAMNSVALHVSSESVENRIPSPVGKDFFCNAMFMSGYAGCGKSSLLGHVTHACYAEKWIVIKCKFDKMTAPHITLANGFNDFFGKVAFVDVCSICKYIFASMDSQLQDQLHDLVPNFSKLFPLLSTKKSQISSEASSTSTEKFGAAKKRLVAFFHILFKSMFAGGRPVLLSLDDMHLSDSYAMEILKEFIFDVAHDTAPGISKESCRSGMYIVGTFRTNEETDDEGIVKTAISLEQNMCTSVTNLSIEELAQSDIDELVSRKLCLPTRYIRELSDLVLSKTRGNPFFVLQFFKAIIQNRMLEFRIKHRRWIWDIDVIDMQMISDGVAQFLTHTFSRLPSSLMHALKIVSCLGGQVDEYTIALLHSEQELAHFNQNKDLDQGVKEGIMEKAGPLYQFTHQILADSIYDLCEDKMHLHKILGVALLKGADGNSTTHLLGVDQVNKCKDDAFSPMERVYYAEANAEAATFSIAASSFEQAQSYISKGMKLLEGQQWGANYALSKKLYELSASVSCMCGDMATMSEVLVVLNANAKTFDDSLTAKSLFVKLYGATSKYSDAVSLSLCVLSTLGEEFPQDISLSMVRNELSAIQITLANIDVERIRLLPQMTDKSKLNAMNFMSLLSISCIIAKPMLLPLLSCRMVSLTLSHGFCEDSIVGLVSAGWTVFTFTTEVHLGYKIIKVGESLIGEAKNSALSVRLFGYIGWSKSIVEPIQSVLEFFNNQYRSGILCGDIESATLSCWSYCAASLHAGVELQTLTKYFVSCIKQSTKYQQNAPLYGAMSNVHACVVLSGNEAIIKKVEVKSHDELALIAERTKNGFLLYHNLLSQMICSFYSRDYLKVMDLADQVPQSKNKRVFDIALNFYEGIASLCLARQTHLPKWRKIGEESLEKMLGWEQTSRWNFEHKRMLLHAELYYLDGRLKLAEESYRSAIESAQKHKFVHEEACACELFGLFLIENKWIDLGKEQLQVAIDKYKQWGAIKKMNEVQTFQELIDTPFWR